VAAASEGQVVLLIGDIAFLHDLGGLHAAARHRIPLVIVVVNNNGGGIFSFLPQAGYPEHFDEFFTTPTGLDLAKAAALFGLQYRAIDRPGAIGPALGAALGAGGAHLLDARAPSIEANVAAHRDAWAAVSGALRAAGL